MRLPKVVQDLISSFEKLPGVGIKTAQRLSFYLLRVPQRDLSLFAESLAGLKSKTRLCEACHNLSERNKCGVCSDVSRDQATVCVVGGFQDVIAIEKSRSYEGVYHVLHGSISPLNNIGPDELYVDSLMKRIRGGNISEIILATSTSLEGEATAMYICQEIEKLKSADGSHVALKTSRIGRGMPTGVEIEYADDDTLSNAINTRIKL